MHAAIQPGWSRPSVATRGGVKGALGRRLMRLAFMALVSVVCGLAGAAVTAAHAAEAKHELTVVLDDTFPPYIFRDQAGRLQGILVDTWALWEKRTGTKVHLVAMEWAKAQVEIQMGRADVIDTIFETAPRKDIYDFGPAYADIEVPIYYHDSITGLQGADSLKGFAVGVMEGDACIDHLLNHGQESFRRYPNYEAVIDAAAVGEVRVFCVGKPPAAYFLQRKQLNKVFRASAPLFTGQFHRAVRKGEAATLKLVEDGFAKITPAEWHQIESRWLGDPAPAAAAPETLWRNGAYGLAGVSMLAILLAAWNIASRRRVQAHTQALTASVQQLTDAKREADAKLARLNATLEAIPDLLFEVDIEGRYVDYHSTRADLLMLPPGELIGKRVQDVLPAEAADLVMQALHEAAAQGMSSGVQIRLDLPDPQQAGEHWFELSVACKREGRAGRDHFIVLSRDISERKHAEQALARHGSEMEMIVQERSRQLVEARDASDRASRAKSEFLSRMSHELRTPMNAILGFSQLLDLDPAASPKAKQFVDEILRAGKHLLHLINDVLDLEQVESGRLTLTPEVLGLRELGADVIALMQPLAHNQQITLNLGVFDGLAVQADAVRVKQIVLNLLSNAVKYNRPGGQVWMDAQATSDRTVRITVRDNGLGIAQRHLPQLFQPFNRLGAEAGPIEGTGIGLSLCKRLAELMHGHVGVESTEGQGSLFWVDLPRAVMPHAAQGDGQPASQQALDLLSPGGPPPSKGAVLLYVEDNPANLQLMEQIVARHQGVTLIATPQGHLGMALARAHRPDLILLDIHLPDIDGYTLLGQLRKEPATRDTPVIAVTANAMPMDVQRIREAGFDDYMAKPIQVTQIDMLIHERLGSTLA